MKKEGMKGITGFCKEMKRQFNLLVFIARLENEAEKKQQGEIEIIILPDKPNSQILEAREVKQDAKVE